MKKISKIEFLNYKAFYGSNIKNNNISLAKGENLLIYGENGAGKSSIYEGIKQFIFSSIDTLGITPSRNLRVSELENVTDTEGNENQIRNEIGLKLSFIDINQNGEVVDTKELSFTNVNNTTENVEFLTKAALLNSFLSYRELLKTYLVDNPKDIDTFQIQFGKLLIETILANRINSATNNTNIHDWKYLHTPRLKKKQEYVSNFKLGLIRDIENINYYLDSLVKCFDKNFTAKINLIDIDVSYRAKEVENRMGIYPYIKADLVIDLQGFRINDAEENHLTVLNEARLSSLAISIYLASIITMPQNNFDFKVLFLDDIFIGLDMSNRLPLLEILSNFKKPIVKLNIDADGNYIYDYERDQENNILTEELPFFKDYQIFITTYDRNWYEVAKRQLNTINPDVWSFLEIFTDFNDQGFTVPFIKTGKSYREFAQFYFNNHDYISCANSLRKALEEKLKNLLPKHEQFKISKDDDGNIVDLKPLTNLEQYISKFISYCEDYDISVDFLKDLKNYKDWYFNPFSHDNIDTPIYKAELENAINLLDRVLSIRMNTIHKAETELFFELEEGDQTRKYQINLKENLRTIIIEESVYYSNPKITCTNWWKGEEEQGNPNWSDNELFSFYKNKSNALSNAIQSGNICNLNKDQIFNKLHNV